MNIGFFKSKDEEFISNVMYKKNFSAMISDFASPVIIPEHIKWQEMKKIDSLGIDYLYVDLIDSGADQFWLREKEGSNTPFIVVLHTVWSWMSRLISIVPLIRKDDIIIATSEYSKWAFSKITNRVKPEVIPHCLDVFAIQKFLLNKAKTGQRPKTITFLGRLFAGKGIDIVIDCLREIREEAGDVHFNIIGPLSSGFMRDHPKAPFVVRLEKKILKLGLKGKVHFKGMRLGQEKYDLLSESDVFANLTTCPGETFPVTNIEALACGVPIVITDWGGNREIVEEGKNGYLVDVNFDKNDIIRVDKEKFIFSIVTILNNKKESDKMKIKARRRSLDYDVLKVMPALALALKKRKKSVVCRKNKALFLKNKTILQLKDYYSDDILPFLCVMPICARPYSSLFDLTVKNKKKRADICNWKEGCLAEKTERENGASEKIIKKMCADLFKSLCRKTDLSA
ncbi:MAG: glycosyltransferase family 4 protein [Candidatus Omnitrophica bacterium]|nr:glycosyltransferase family 4 protein [Candidatus Omnitrophota bacterium]